MGIVAQINVSRGGVPKLPVEEVEVDSRGLVGDRQATPIVHGGTERAISLWSQEVIEQLQAEGHPIKQGSAGENLTISGIPWTEVQPGVQLQIGADVRLEITCYAAPCQKNAQWFADGRFSRISQKKHPGSSRVCAKVLAPGTVRVGDSVELRSV